MGTPDVHRRWRGLRWSATAALAGALMCVPAATATVAEPGASPPAPADVQPTPPAPDTQAAPAPASPAAEAALREETVEVARQVVKDFPGDANAHGLLGIVYNHYGRTAEAVECWQKCTEIDPRRADAYYGLAVIAQRKGEFQKAAQLWRKAEELDPTLRGLYIQYAETLQDMGQWQEAIAAAEKAIAAGEGTLPVYLVLGKARLQLKEYDKALAAYEKAHQIRPNDARPLYGLATTYARLGQADKARQYMEQFARLRDAEDKTAVKEHQVPDDGSDDRAWGTVFLATTCTDAGGLYAVHGNLAKAEEHWRRAAALDPRNLKCRQGLAQLYTQTGRPQQALAACNELRALAPKDAAVHLNVGALLARLRLYDAAEEAARRGLELAPGHAAGYRLLAEVLLLRGQKADEAKTLAGKLVELQPTATHYGMLGEACLRAGDVAGARAAVQRAMQLEPDNAAIKAIYDRLGTKE
ncbi:MAG: tetratricopeptide repeat protein [Planctomycetes bacterium]|nr:tetratricopeptide repeat protein [Planctomycetota bacterium]